MPLKNHRLSWAQLGVLVLAGCRQDVPNTPGPSAATTPEAVVPAPRDVTLSAEEVATIEKLPEPDRSAALAQKVADHAIIRANIQAGQAPGGSQQGGDFPIFTLFENRPIKQPDVPV